VNTATWLADRTGRAPEVLRARTAARVAGVAGSPEEVLAGAAVRALRDVRAGPGTRAEALDLLVADALVTLALLACAERDPAALEAFARRLRDAGAGLP
jgi:hypothetical protein